LRTWRRSCISSAVRASSSRSLVVSSNALRASSRSFLHSSNIYACVCTYAYMFVNVYINMYIHARFFLLFIAPFQKPMHVRIYVCTCMYAWNYLYMYVFEKQRAHRLALSCKHPKSMYLYVHTHFWICTYKDVHTHAFRFDLSCTNVCVYAHQICTWPNTNRLICVYIYLNTYVHELKYIYMCICL